MANNFKETLSETKQSAALLRAYNKHALDAFSSMRNSIIVNETLDPKVRELIAIAVAVSKQCEPCIASHVAQAKAAGASAEEVAAATGVAMAMSAGAAYVYSLKTLEAYEQL